MKLASFHALSCVMTSTIFLRWSSFLIPNNIYSFKMVLICPRIHFYEINDQTWYQLDYVLVYYQLLIESTQVPSIPPRESTVLPHSLLDIPSTRLTESFTRTAYRKHPLPNPRRSCHNIHIRWLLRRRRRPNAIHREGLECPALFSRSQLTIYHLCQFERPRT